MYIELEEGLIEEVEKVTCGSYKKKGDLLDAEYVNEMVNDLLNEIDRLNEKLEDTKEQMEYMKPMSEYELQGMSQRDFGGME